jgi:hypothetical protein
LDESRFPKFDASRDNYRKWKKKVEEQVFRARDGKGREDFAVHFIANIAIAIIYTALDDV